MEYLVITSSGHQWSLPTGVNTNSINRTYQYHRILRGISSSNINGEYHHQVWNNTVEYFVVSNNFRPSSSSTRNVIVNKNTGEWNTRSIMLAIVTTTWGIIGECGHSMLVINKYRLVNNKYINNVNIIIIVTNIIIGITQSSISPDGNNVTNIVMISGYFNIITQQYYHQVGMVSSIKYEYHQQ